MEPKFPKLHRPNGAVRLQELLEHSKDGGFSQDAKRRLRE